MSENKIVNNNNNNNSRIMIVIRNKNVESSISYRLIKRLVIVGSILSALCTCSLPTNAAAQDIYSNTVNIPNERELMDLSYPGASSSNAGSTTTGLSGLGQFSSTNNKASSTINYPKTKSSLSSKQKTLAALIIDYVCPSNELAGFALLFSVPCRKSGDTECRFLGKDQRCCNKICRKGIPAPPKEPKHRAVLGVNRTCPKEPVPEILPVTTCVTDIDCEDENRVCCPDKDFKLYCRTAAPVWSQLPFPLTHAPLMSIIGFMQCQTAPPQLLDLFPQPCNRTIECLPNLCCQEGSNKFCRPPKKSVLSLVAQATQRFARG